LSALQNERGDVTGKSLYNGNSAQSNAKIMLIPSRDTTRPVQVNKNYIYDNFQYQTPETEG
jgi:hypothetical protein